MIEKVNKPILHLNLIRKWFDMVGVEKLEEYRANSDFWSRTFVENGTKIKIKGVVYNPQDVIICFSNGYSKNRPQKFFEISSLFKGEGIKDWGAEEGVKYFVLKLGNQITLL